MAYLLLVVQPVGLVVTSLKKHLLLVVQLAELATRQKKHLLLAVLPVELAINKFHNLSFPDRALVLSGTFKK